MRGVKEGEEKGGGEMMEEERERRGRKEKEGVCGRMT